MARRLTTWLVMVSACLLGLSWGLDLSTIVKASAEAMLTGTAKENMDVLQKYYFTDDKAASIWPLVYNATITTSSYEYGFDELVNIEKDTARIAKHLKFCMDIAKKVERANCLANTIPIVKQVQDDTTWHYDADIVLEEIARQIHFFVAIRSMLGNSLRVVEANLGSIPNVPQRKVHEEFIRDYFKVVLREVAGTRYMETSVPKMEKTWEYAAFWRKDQVSAVEICQQKTIMWKDFSQGCETRWKRSTISASDAAEEASDAGDSDEEESVDEKQNHIIRNNEYLKSIEEKVTGIGATLHDTQSTITATVTDTITGEKLYKARRSTDGTNHKGDIMEEMVKEGNSVREKYVNKLQGSIKEAFSYIDLFTDGAFDKLAQLTKTKPE